MLVEGELPQEMMLKVEKMYEIAIKYSPELEAMEKFFLQRIGDLPKELQAEGAVSRRKAYIKCTVIASWKKSFDKAGMETNQGVIDKAAAYDARQRQIRAAEEKISSGSATPQDFFDVVSINQLKDMRTKLETALNPLDDSIISGAYGYIPKSAPETSNRISMINAIIAAKKADEEKVGDTPNVLNKQYHQFGDVQIDTTLMPYVVCGVALLVLSITFCNPNKSELEIEFLQDF